MVVRDMLHPLRGREWRTAARMAGYGAGASELTERSRRRRGRCAKLAPPTGLGEMQDAVGRDNRVSSQGSESTERTQWGLQKRLGIPLKPGRSRNIEFKNDGTNPPRARGEPTFP